MSAIRVFRKQFGFRHCMVACCVHGRGCQGFRVLLPARDRKENLGWGGSRSPSIVELIGSLWRVHLLGLSMVGSAGWRSGHLVGIDKALAGLKFCWRGVVSMARQRGRKGAKRLAAAGCGSSAKVTPDRSHLMRRRNGKVRAWCVTVSGRRKGSPSRWLVGWFRASQADAGRRFGAGTVQIMTTREKETLGTHP